MTREEMRERVADLVRFNKDPVAIAEEAIAVIRGETLEEAAKECDRLGGLEQNDYGLGRNAQNYFRARNAIRDLKDKP